MRNERQKPFLGDPKETIAVLNKYGFTFQKKFGQNFLIDTHVLDKIIAAAEITPDDFVVEMRPDRNDDAVSGLCGQRSLCGGDRPDADPHSGRYAERL